MSAGSCALYELYRDLWIVRGKDIVYYYREETEAPGSASPVARLKEGKKREKS